MTKEEQIRLLEAIIKLHPSVNSTKKKQALEDYALRLLGNLVLN